MDLILNMKETLKAEVKHKIVFPEGAESRVINAAARLAAEGLLTPVLLGDKLFIESNAQGLGVSLEGIEIINPETFEQKDAMIEAFVEARKGKATAEQAAEAITQTNYFGTMLVKMGLADGLVGGVIYSTGDMVRPALQIIKTKPGVSTVSGVFYMSKGEEAYIMGDAALNVNPDSQGLADIAKACVLTAPKFGIETPKVAFLSFSSMGSAKAPEVEKVQEAVKIFKEENPDVLADGELQFDAAVVPTVAMQKAPQSDVAGSANILIFPTLDAGNIGYKIAQRFGGYEALGPILLGLNSPINDLSRGSSVEDIYKVAIITSAQVR